MRLLTRLAAATAIVVVPVIGLSAGSASAGVVDCTVQYPFTLITNPYDPTDVGIIPIRTGGAGNYVLHDVSSSVGYANCVLFG